MRWRPMTTQASRTPRLRPPPASTLLWVAVAPVPTGSLTTRAIGCSTPVPPVSDAGTPTQSVVQALTLDAHDVYGIWTQSGQHAVVFRVGR